MDNEIKEAFQYAYLELGGLGEHVLGEETAGEDFVRMASSGYNW